MIKKIVFVIVFLNTINTLFCQEKIGEFENTLKNSSFVIKESFSIVNENNNDVATFLLEGKNIYGYLKDKNLKVKYKVSTSDRRRKYKNLVSYMYDDKNNYWLLMADVYYKKFALLKFSFSEGEVSLKETKNVTSDILYLQSVQRKNKMHLIYLNKISSKLIVKTLKVDGTKKVKVYDFKKEKFLIDETRETSLAKLIQYHFSAGNFIYNTKNDVKYYEVEKIDHKGDKLVVLRPDVISSVESVFDSSREYHTKITPLSIDKTCKKNKLYVNDSTVTFTFDKNKFFTQVLTMNLDNGNYSLSKFKKPQFEIKQSKKVTNSFLKNGYIFLVSCTKKELVLEIIDTKNNDSVKTFKVSIDKPITFKNGPIIQEGGSYKNYRELEKTKKFLRKVYNSEIGLSVLSIKVGYEITLGGEKIISNDMVINSGMNPFQTSTFNPHFGAFNSSYSTKSTYLKGVFDKKFSHIRSATIDNNAFDDIKKFIKSKKIIRSENLFVLNGENILGYYDPKKKNYYFHKFSN